MSSQPTLFPNALKPLRPTAQQANLARVSKDITPLVLSFCQERIGREFFMEELTKYVRKRSTIAPDSAGRILRNLRAQGRVDYVVVNRAKSLYRIEEVR